MAAQFNNRLGLLAALRELAPLVSDHESLATFNPKSTQYRHNRETAVKTGPPVDQIAALVAQEPALAAFDQTSLRTSPISSWSGRYFHLARWLLAQSRLRDPEVAVQRLEQFLARNASDALEVVPLWGLNPTRAISLAADIQLVPFADVPATVPKDMLSGISSARFADKNTFAWAPRPRAALLRTFVHAPILNPAGVKGESWTGGLGAPDTRADYFLELARLLTILRPSAVYPVAHWFQLEEGIPVIGSVGGWGGYEYHRRFVEEVEPEDYDPQAILNLVSEYFALSEGMRRRLAVPLERLRQAFLSETPVDTALDLGIALEALLTHEHNSDAPISYRIRLRATHLVGGDAEQRKATAKRVGIAYRLRNRAAHGGSVDDVALKEEGGSGSVQDYLQDCAALTAVMIRSLVSLRQFPDWEGLAMGWAPPAVT